MKLTDHLEALLALRERMDPNDARDAVAIPNLDKCIEQCRDDIVADIVVRSRQPKSSLVAEHIAKLNARSNARRNSIDNPDDV